MDEIIRRLRNRDKKSLNYLKDSMIVEGKLLEKDEEEELPPTEDEEIDNEVPEETSDEEVSQDDTETEETPEDEESENDTPGEDSSEDAESEGELYVNPLDNPYAVQYTIGHKVALTYADGSKTEITGEVEGYDKAGFYRVQWSNGRTMNGITDIALSEIIEHTEENKCICGNTEFVTEGDNTICDNCGRHIKESSDPLTLADKSRPKGRKLIRSEAHPVSTALSEECATKRTIQDAIRNAFKTKKLEEEVNDISFAKLERALSGEFWTRKSELVEDIVAEGFDVPDYNDEYVVVSIGEDEEDEEYREFLIPIGGTSRTMTLDFDRAREL